MQYPVAIHKDFDSDYGVTVPDLPGCFSAGDSVEEAIVSVVEAIECHVEGLLIDEEDVPVPLSLETHKEKFDFSDAFAWMFVDVDFSKISRKS
jgi:predicted RNase H-like HicB family nuclease